MKKSSVSVTTKASLNKLANYRSIEQSRNGLYSPVSFLSMNTRYDQRIFYLAQLWKTGNMNDEELNAWYQALEDTPLGPPDGVTVERVEKRLHEQLN